GGAAQGAQRVVGGGESDRLGVAADQQQVVGGVDEPGGDELVVFPQVDGDDAGGAGGVELRQLGLLHQAGAGGEHQVGGGVVVAQRQHLGDLLVREERHQVGDVVAPGVAGELRQLVRLGAVHPALVGEEQDPVVCGRHEEVLDDVVL